MLEKNNKRGTVDAVNLDVDEVHLLEDRDGLVESSDLCLHQKRQGQSP